MRLLLVEDERALADGLADGLRREGYAVDVAYHGAAALARMGENDVELMILDRDLPVLTGDALCRLLRQQGHPVRILMLTAAGTLDDRVAGLDLGADDYLAKPFAYVELLARLRALARRTTPGSGTVLEAAGVRVDTVRRIAERAHSADGQGVRRARAAARRRRRLGRRRGAARRRLAEPRRARPRRRQVRRAHAAPQAGPPGPDRERARPRLPDRGGPMTRARAFRVRLAALIAGVFVAGGAALLGVQYLLTRQLFQDRIGSIEGLCVSDVGEVSLGDCTQPSDAQLGFSDGTSVFTVSIAQTTQLSREVLSGLLGWSVVVMLAFAALAVAAAWWLAKRSLDPLYDALTRQDRFIAGASHELRTPLTTSRTLLEIPLAQGRVPEDLEPAVRGALVPTSAASA